MQTFGLLGLSVSASLLFKGDSSLGNAPVSNLSSGHGLTETLPAIPYPSKDGDQITKIREKIADEFGIEIQTLDEVSIAAPAARVLNGLEGLLFSSQNWDEQSLNLLEYNLKNFPKKFYQQDKNGEKVHIILDPTSHCGPNAKDFIITPYPREIMLSPLFFNPEHPLTAGWVLAHEFGHLVTTDSCRQTDSPYFDKIEAILGGNFDQVKQDLSGKIQTKAEQSNLNITEGGFVLPIESIKTPEQEEAVRLTRLKYGTSNQEEFIAVMFESYFLGKDYFFRTYEPFLGKEKTQNLYNFAKTFYNGKEYPGYHVIADLLKR